MSDSGFGRGAGTRSVLAVALLLAVVAGVLAPVLQAPLFMDDYAHLWAIESPTLGLARLGANSYGIAALDDAAVRSLLPWWTSPDFRFDYYRPASTMLLALELELWGRGSAGYHATSLAAHLFAVALVFVLAARIGIERRGALAAGALFALHPGNLVAVYWVSNVSDLVALSLSIAALLAYRAAARTERRPWLLHGLAAIALVLAILTKELACLVPAAFALHDWLGLGSAHGKPPRSRAEALRRAARALPYVALSAAYVAWYRATGHGIRSGYAPCSLEGPPLAKLAFATRSAILAAVELTTGLPPSTHRHERLLDGVSAVLAVSFVAAVAIAVVVVLRNERRRPLRLFALGWVILFTAPTLGFLASPRYLYVASVGWALLVGSLIDGWLGRAAGRGRHAAVAVATTLYVATLPALADRWLLRRFGDELGRAFPGVVEGCNATVGPPRDGERVILVNTPSPATASLIGATFRFLHPGIDIDAAVLTSFATPPTLIASDAHTVRVVAPPGHHYFEQPVDWIYLTSRRFSLGQTFRGAGFDAAITALDGDQPVEVSFRFDRPLDDSALVPICFDGADRTLRRCPFPRPPSSS